MSARWMWTAGLAVALAAAVATAHGSFEVARAAGVPGPVALLYPAITDGLALVAYATTTRLAEGGRRYAWSVVVLAAGLSGVAQAVWLAGGLHGTPVALRLGVGAWPATAAAVVAHLLYLLTCGEPDAPYTPLYGAVEQSVAPVVSPAPLPASVGLASDRSGPHEPGSAPLADPDPSISAGDRARVAARAHLGRHHALPTVSQLVATAGVARGTAATVLKQLRAEPVEGTTP
jgi:hypothetical protein